jgi:hypothetical protein
VIPFFLFCSIDLSLSNHGVIACNYPGPALKKPPDPKLSRKLSSDITKYGQPTSIQQIQQNHKKLKLKNKQEGLHSHRRP